MNRHSGLWVGDWGFWMGIRAWGSRIGDWGLVIEDWTIGDPAIGDWRLGGC